MNCLRLFDRVIRKDYEAFIPTSSFELMLPDSNQWLDGDIIDYVLEYVLNFCSVGWRPINILTVTLLILVCFGQKVGLCIGSRLISRQ